MISELFVQISRSRASPVCTPSHMGKCMVNLLLKIYQNHYFHGKHDHLIRHNYGKMHVKLTVENLSKSLLSRKT